MVDCFYRAALFQADALGSTLSNAAMGALLFAPPIGWVALRLFRRRMLAGMRLRQLAPVPAAWWQRRAASRSRNGAPHGPDVASPPQTGLRETMQARRQRIVRATWAAYAALVLLTAAIALASVRVDLHPITGFTFLAAVLALGAVTVNLRPEITRRNLGVTLLPLPALLLLQGLFTWVSHYVDVRALQPLTGTLPVAQTLGGVAAVSALTAAGLERRLRAVLLPSTLVAFWICLFFFSINSTRPPCPTIRDALPGSGLMHGLLFSSVVALLAWAFVRLGIQLLRGLVVFYRRGLTSDISLTAAADVAMLGYMLGVSIEYDHGGMALGTLQALTVLGGTLATYAIVLGHRAPSTPAPVLLVLRVFAKGTHSQRLLDAIQQRWRLAGPVLEIGGPDLIALSADLHDIATWYAGNAHDLFLPEVPSVEALSGVLELAPDREGRFRISEVFCIDTSWEGTVSQLIDVSHVILLDLRGFSGQRAGVRTEIGLLLRQRAIHKVVALVDPDTDRALVDTLLDDKPRTAPGWALREVPRYSRWPWHDVRPEPLFEDLLAVAGR